MYEARTRVAGGPAGAARVPAAEAEPLHAVAERIELTR
jgi:hypothetical protein